MMKALLRSWPRRSEKNMFNCIESCIPAERVQSLVWDGDELVDWVSGGQRYRMTGEVISRHVYYAYPFDAAVSLAGSGYAAIYANLGTKGLVLRGGEIIREINRSYYQANAFEYPIAMFRLPSGRAVLAHCPDEYCRLQIEDLATGEILAKSSGPKAADFFHSRLAASPSGRYLLSAGWIWHPVDAVNVYDLATALVDSTQLDQGGLRIDAWAEESSAVFLPDGRLLVALNGIEDEEGEAIKGGELRLFDLDTVTLLAAVPTAQQIGSMMPVGNDHVLALHEHPSLVDLRTGLVVQSWPHLQTGTQTSSIVRGTSPVPPMARDAHGRRLAVAQEAGITVLHFAN